MSSNQPDRRGVLIRDRSSGKSRSPVTELLIPALLLRAGASAVAEVVHVYAARGPTVAFSARDLRSPGFAEAEQVARAAGFSCVVRSPGGRMVAYDSGAVVIDHITHFSDKGMASAATFAESAAHHLTVLRSLGHLDARVGEIEGEYCPGEFSINIGGAAKVLGSAQRITGAAALFSTVVQVTISDPVRQVLIAVSAALGYPLRTSSIAGLTDFAAGRTSSQVADAFRADYRARLALLDADIPANLAAHVAGVTVDEPGVPFRVDDWARAHPLPVVRFD